MILATRNDNSRRFKAIAMIPVEHFFIWRQWSALFQSLTDVTNVGCETSQKILINTNQWTFFLFPSKFIINNLYGTLPHPATRPSKTYSKAVRAIPLPVCHQGPLNGYRTGFKKCSDAQQIYSANSCRWHKCKSGWSLKTERSIVNDMYTLILLIQYGIYFWHELAYTLLHFLKLNSNICGNPLAFSLTLTCNTIWTVLRHTSALIKYKWE